MTIHYHGTPITPRSVLETLAGASFCVSFKSPNDVRRCHEIGESVMLDSGAFSFWRNGGALDVDAYYAWAKPWLECPTTWAVVADIIDGDESVNRSLTLSCPIPRRKMAPVWHLHESLDYLDELVDGGWNRVCFGSSGAYAEVGTDQWHRQVGEAFDRIWDRTPSIHMLRGMRCSNMAYPFASVDSTDIARNHSNKKMTAADMRSRWDGLQPPIGWRPQPQQQDLFEETA